VVSAEAAAVEPDFPELETIVFDFKTEPSEFGEFWNTNYVYTQQQEQQSTEDASRPRTFVFTTYEMVNDPKNAMAIGFNDEGNVIEIRDLDLLSEKTLPLYFRHKNVTSFYRQLNSYGFRTTRSSMTNVVHAFSHDLFRANRPELLSGISRKRCMKKLARMAAQKEEEEEKMKSTASPPSPMSVSSGSSDEVAAIAVKPVAVVKTVAAPKKRVPRPAPTDVESLHRSEVEAAERMQALQAMNRRLEEENRAVANESSRIVNSVNELVDVQTSLIQMLFGAEAAKAFADQSMPFRLQPMNKIEEQARDFEAFNNATTEMFGSDEDFKLLEDIFANETEQLFA
jgi:hypothetical protein